MASVGHFLFVCIILAAIIVNQGLHAKQTGCSASPLIPDTPFVVVWNHPTHNCEDKGIHIDFQKWGIVDNERDRFFGQKIVLLYNLGKWPYYRNEQPVNAGLPQLADINAHIAKVDVDLRTDVWNKSFSGLGVIDMEHWRPLYWLNFDSLKIYQEKSLALAKQRFPQYNTTQLKEEAIKEFDTAAREMMEKTLNEVTMKRPEGKWGYYLYPRTWGKTSTIPNNDRMSWVFQKSTGLYPSIYFHLKEPPSSRQERIKDTLHEAIRVKAKYSPQIAPIMPYALNQDGPYQMFDKTDLSYAIMQPANMGSSGIVLWGSSHDALAKNECVILQNYVENTLGPYSLYVTNFFGNCTQQLCHSHGRCVRKDYEKTYQFYLRESGRNECLMSPKQLANKTPSENLKPKNTRNATDRNRSSNTRKEKIFAFLKHFKMISDSRKPKFNSKNVHKMNVKFDDGLEESSRQWNLIYLIQQVFRKHGSSKFPLKDTQKKIESEKVEKSFTNFIDSDDHQFLNSFPGFEDENPDYDFDDYVCKCFPGYSGTHCENTES